MVVENAQISTLSHVATHLVFGRNINILTMAQNQLNKVFESVDKFTLGAAHELVPLC